MTWLRSVLFNLYFFGLTFVLAVGGIFVRLFAPQRTLAYAQFWVRLVIAGLRRICGIYLVLHGEENLPRAGPALIASQHQSAYDTLIWLILLPRPAYVLKQELQRIPLFGPLTRVGGMIAIDRNSGPAALRSLLRQTADAVADGRQIVIFPEGTRSAPGEHPPLQPGIAAMAAQTRMPVIPVVTDSGLRWGRRSFRKRPGPIQIAILPPIPPGLKREALMRRLEAALRSGVGGVVDNPVNTPSCVLPSRTNFPHQLAGKSSFIVRLTGKDEGSGDGDKSGSGLA